MGSKGEGLKGSEIAMTEKRNVNGNDVVLNIRTEGDAKAVTGGGGRKGSSSKELATAAPKQTQVDSACQALSELGTRVSKSGPLSCLSPEIASLSPSRKKPPKAPNAPKQTHVDSACQASSSSTGVVTSAPRSYPSPETVSLSPSRSKQPKASNANESLVWRRSLNKLTLVKPKSRFGEQPYLFDATRLKKERNASLQEQVGQHSPFRDSFNQAVPNNRSMHLGGDVPVTQEKQCMKSPGPAGGGAGKEDDEEIYKKVTHGLNKAKHKIMSKTLVECAVFFLILGCLVTSLTVNQLEASKPWGLEIWKWCVLVMALFSGMSVTNWVMHFIIFLIERKFLLQKKVLYFVDGLEKSIQVFTWLAFVLLTWVLLFNGGVKRSHIANKVLDYITWTLGSILIGSFLWFLKTLLLKIFVLSFHVTALFDRIQEYLSHHNILQKLSRRPPEEAERLGKDPGAHQFSFGTMKNGKTGVEEKVVDVGKIRKMEQTMVSALTMNMLVDAVRNMSLSNVSNELDESDDGGVEQVDKEITTEQEAMVAAYHIFKNIIPEDRSYLSEDDLQRFMDEEDVNLVFPTFEGAETGKIDIQSFVNWVVKVYRGHKALLYALTDTKTAVRQLNNLVTGILIVITIIIWLLLMEIATTKVLVLLSSQLVMAAFIFGDTCKKIFEGIIFVFVTHPFDVGDRCVIDGVQLIVEEMNIMSTVFLTLDNKKNYYPNSVLATKPITNYHRSPDGVDKVEFSIEFTTPSKDMGAMKEAIKEYLERTPQHWHQYHNVFVSEMVTQNRIKMGLYVNHTMNFQDYLEKTRRRTELVMELKRIFDKLNIGYDLLHQGE